MLPIIKKAVRIIMYLILVLILLFILIVGAVNLPFVHTYITSKTNNILAENGIPIHIGKVSLLINGKIGISEIEMITAQTDTIIYAEQINVDIDIMPLFSRQLSINEVNLNNAVVNLIEDSITNELNIVSVFKVNEKVSEEDDNLNKKNSWDVTGQSVSLKDIRFKYSDSAGGILVKQSLEKANIELDYFSLKNQQIDVNNIQLEKPKGMVGVWEGIEKNIIAEEKEDSVIITSWNFSVKKIRLTDLFFRLEQPDIGSNINVSLEKGDISQASLDLLNNEINAGKIALNQPEVTFENVDINENQVELEKEEKVNSDSFSFSLPMLSWNINSEKIEIEKGSLSMNNLDAKQARDSSQWFPLHNINIVLSKSKVTPKGYFMNLPEISLAVSNTMKIKSGALDFYYDSLQNFKLLSSLDFVPDEKTNKRKIPGQISFNTKIEGNTSAVQIHDFDLVSTNGLQFNLYGTLLNPFEFPNSVCDIQFTTSAISRKKLSPILVNFNQQFELPNFKTVSLSGKISNTVFNPNFDIQINSESGQIEASGNYDFHKEKGSTKILFTEILLSELIDDNYPEMLTGKISVEGAGNNISSINGKANIEIDSIQYKNKITQNISIDATAENNEIEFTTAIADSALNCDLEGSFKWVNNQSFMGKLKGYLDIDLFEMKLMPDPFSGKAEIDASLSYSPDEIVGSAIISEVLLSNENSTETINKLIFDLNTSGEKIEFYLETDFLVANFISYAPLIDIRNAYDATQLKKAVKIDSANFINLNAITVLDSLFLEAKIEYNPVFQLFYPDTIFNFSDIDIQIKKTEKDSTIKGIISSEWISFGELKSSKNKLTASLKPNRLKLNVNSKNISDNDLKFGEFDLNIDVFETSIKGNLIAHDQEGNELHNLGFLAEEKNDLVIFQSSVENWLINKNEWTLSPPEFLTWNKTTKSYTASLNMNYDEHSIGITGNDTEIIELNLKNVDLNNFAFPGLRDLMPRGIIDGSATYSRKSENHHDLNLNMQMNDLEWRNIAVNQLNTKGHLIADEKGITDSEFMIIANDTASIRVQLESNNLKNEYQIKSNFEKVQFSLLEPFIDDFADNLHGITGGEITLSILNNSVELNGEIKFDHFGLKVKPLETWLSIPANKIVIQQNKFIFEDFTVIDSLKRPLVVNGNVHFIDKNNIQLNLKVDADRIKLMNTKESKKAPVYGSIVVNSGITIKGSIKRPTIKGNIELERGTDLTYQLIQDLSVSGSQNDVIFANITDSLNVVYPISGDIKRMTKMPKIETTIKINPKSILNVKVNDLYNVDISIKGNGLLNYNMLSNNTMNLNGDYTINSGKCDLKITGWPIKNFTITPGSSLNWNGNPENPGLNIEATSKVRGSYLNPIDNRTRVVDFVVTMQFTNQLSDLEINFGVQSSDQYITSVLSSLSSDEITRQAINLLLFSTIEIPGVESSSNYLASQISSFWESQINNFTSNNMNKTKLSFGIDTYNNSSAQGAGNEQTSLTYEMERKFLDDRVTVTLSGKLNDYNEGKYQANSLLENLIVEYALDSLNTKNIKLYQKRDYEDMLEGEVVKYGIGFLYRKSYKKLSDIWRRKKNQRLETQKNSDK